MPKLPILRTSHSPGIPVQSTIDIGTDDSELRLHQVASVLWSNRWVILGCIILGLTLAVIYGRITPPAYLASTTVRIDENARDLPTIFRALPQGSEVGTEMEVLSSRRLTEDATRLLGLQLRVVKPLGLSRAAVLDDVKVAEDARPAGLRLVRQQGRFSVRDVKTGREIATVAPGGRIEAPGASFRLLPDAEEHEEIELAVSRFYSAVGRVSAGISVRRPTREADVIVLSYEDTDRDLAWRVPNTIVEQFITRRREVLKTEARSQVAFLRGQLDTLNRQLGLAEEELKEFRERARVVMPMVEAQSQIQRLVSLETDRSTLEAERAALAELIARVDQERTRTPEGQPSPYRRLLAFPSLLRSQAASDLLNSLTRVEDDRATLLARRTAADPDVRLLTARVEELEAQLGSIARTYLDGLTNQVGSLDATINQFGAELRSMPRKELEYGRLERRPAVLKEIYTLLQTRLKEAEMAQAVEDATVTVVDEAITPRSPVRPNKRLAYLAGVFGGALLGIGLTVGRELFDRSVRTRADVTSATGLPVLALIPRMGRRGLKTAMIAVRSVDKHRGATPPAPPPPPPPPAAAPLPPWAPTAEEPSREPERPRYTFLTDPDERPAPPPPPPEVPRTAAAAPGGGGLIRTPPAVHLTLSELGSAMAEAYSILQTNIAFSRVEEPVKTLVFTSALPGEGKTTTAVNLAIALTERGYNVLLMDADLRRGQVHHLLGFPREPGLSDMLHGRCDFETARRQVVVETGRGFTAVSCGAPEGSPAALVGSDAMRSVLEWLRVQFDLIIIDTPPVNILTDAALLGCHADGVVLVARAGSTEVPALEYAVEQLAHVRAPALGVVLNDIDLKRYGSYDGAYRYVDYSAYLGPTDES